MPLTRLVGALNGSHSIPTTYDRLPGALNATHGIPDVYVWRAHRFGSRYDILHGWGPIYGAFAGQHAIEAAIRRRTTVSAKYELRAPVYRRGAIDGSHAQFAYVESWGHVQFRHKLFAGPLKVYGVAQGRHSLAARDYGLTKLFGRHNLRAREYAYRLFLADANFAARHKITNKVHVAYDVLVPVRRAKTIEGHSKLSVWQRAAAPWTAAHDLDAYQKAVGSVTLSHDLLTVLRAAGGVTFQHNLLAYEIRVGRLHGGYTLFVDEFNPDLLDYLHAWAVNARTGAPSRYKGFPFHSYAPTEEGGLGAATDGIYALDANDDDGDTIMWEFETPWYAGNLPDEGGLRLKRFASALVAGRIGQLELEPWLDDAKFRPRMYRRQGNIHQSSRVRFKFARGYKSRLLKLLVRNVDGGTSAIESIDLEFEHLESREQ